MSYEFYKVIHLASLVFVVACLGVNFFTDVPKKWARIGGMTASFLLMVAGMGLVARTKVGWPGWVIAKLMIWCVVAIGAPILAKRLTKNREMAFLGLIGLLVVAICFAILQPF